MIFSSTPLNLETAESTEYVPQKGNTHVVCIMYMFGNNYNENDTKTQNTKKHNTNSQNNLENQVAIAVVAVVVVVVVVDVVVGQWTLGFYVVENIRKADEP